jgi:hypothetical protein
MDDCKTIYFIGYIEASIASSLDASLTLYTRQATWTVLNYLQLIGSIDVSLRVFDRLYELLYNCI